VQRNESSQKGLILRGTCAGEEEAREQKKKPVSLREEFLCGELGTGRDDLRAFPHDRDWGLKEEKGKKSAS